ncbi:MAG TPA: hypothetical protein VFN75_08795, partial [Pseudonocardiaceae bacterium]|nr:hypothetical protein [Pseudonocardiaceae bacterium]
MSEPTPPQGYEVASTASLEQLLERMQPTLLQVLVAPRGYDISVNEAVIYDVADSTATTSESLVLAVGLNHEATVIALLRQLARTRPAGLVVKLPDPPSEALQEAAADVGIAILLAAREIIWGRLYDLITTALRGTSAPARPVGQPPLGDLFSLANAIAAMVGGATT